MPDESVLSIIVRLQDEASAQLAAMSAKVAAAGETMGTMAGSIGTKLDNLGKSMVGMGNSMKGAGTSMSMGLTLPIVALGTVVTESAMKFEAAMQLIQTQAGASSEEVTKMTTAVLALAKSGETGQGPQKLADGLYHLESLGLRGAAALDALKVSAQAADLGIADMEGVTNALGAAIVTGIDGTQNLSQAMGLLDATIGQGNMRMDELVAALGTGILPAAKNFGLTLRDVGAALATLTDNGMRADESATRLRMTFSLMAAPTQKAKDALATIGLGAYDLANDMRGPNGLVTAVKDLNQHLQDSGANATQQAAILSEAFGGGRTSAAILTLTQQVDRLSTKYEMIGAQADTFNEKVAATHQTNLYKMNAAMAGMSAVMIDLGGTVMPIVVQMLQQLATWLQKASAWWDGLSSSTQSTIVKVLAVTAALGPLLYILGTVTTAIGYLVIGVGKVFTAIQFLVTWLPILWTAFVAGGPIVWAITAAVVALALLAIVVYKNWGPISAFFKQMWADIKFVWDATIDYISDKMLAFAGAWNAAWSAIGNFLKEVWNGIIMAARIAIDLLVGAIIIDLNFLFPGWQKVLKSLYTAWVDFWTSVRTIAAALWTAIAAGFQAFIGGLVAFFAPKLKAIADAWQLTWGGIRDFFNAVAGVLRSAVDSTFTWISNKVQNVLDLWNKMVGVVSKPVNSVFGAVSSFGNTVGSAFNSVVQTGASVMHFEKGGYVNAPRGTEVPAILHGGEQVIPAEQNTGRGGGSQNIVLNFNFNDAVAGDDGIQQIITKTIQQINRKTLLRTLAGA